MITDSIINVFMFLPYMLLNALDSLNFSLTLPSDFYETLNNISVGVGYVLPVAKLLPIFIATIGIYGFRIIWALVIRIKSFIPSMGS